MSQLKWKLICKYKAFLVSLRGNKFHTTHNKLYTHIKKFAQTQSVWIKIDPKGNQGQSDPKQRDLRIIRPDPNCSPAEQSQIERKKTQAAA